MITDLLHIPLAKPHKSHKIKTIDELSNLDLLGVGVVAILISSTVAILMGVG